VKWSNHQELAEEEHVAEMIDFLERFKYFALAIVVLSVPAFGFLPLEIDCAYSPSNRTT
jgi:hypothetical protein